MKGAEVRQAFLSFFKSKGHEVVASSSLVPENDPTLLFSNAGMNQFKELFLGAERRSYTTATTAQKCMRISGKHNDLENVGETARHHTFFEMLGNFSFGEYFKRDAIKYAWEFSTEVLKLDKSRLWATVFEDDEEALKLWHSETDIVPERVLRYGEKDNFWAMGETGPCGPCSELFYYIGDDVPGQSEAEFRKDDGTYLEFWNLVFMQFDRSADGELNPLPKPSVDTGMGLERITSILQGVGATYDTDLLRPIITRTEELSGFKYDGSSYERRDLKTDISYARDVAMRVIADHSRAIAFLIADGVRPASDGRGYVLRRLLRRAVRHGRALNFNDPFLVQTTQTVVDVFGHHYKELVEARDLIAKLTEAEERKFNETLESGLHILNSEVSKLKSGAQFPGETAFLLHDTYGFPLDLTQDALKAEGIQVDVDGFERAMGKQKQRSREDRKAQQIGFEAVTISSPPTAFKGYEVADLVAELTQVIVDDQAPQVLGAGDQVSLLFDATPFYAESGGQVGDTGSIELDGVTFDVQDTQKIQNDYIIHHCVVAKGEFEKGTVGKKARLCVDAARRRRVRSNHSATHLVHFALRTVLGDHVKQAGSRVDDRSLRFDYSHFDPVSSEQLRDIQMIVNEQVRSNHQVSTNVLPIEEAKKTGAIALFGEKYGDLVRVVTIGPDSVEFCGGTHVDRSGDIGLVMIASEGGIASGVRRIECWSGDGAINQLMLEREERTAIAGVLKSDATGLADKVEKLSGRARTLEKEVEQLKSKLASAASGEMADNVRTSPNGVKVITEMVSGADAQTLRTMVDRLRLKLGSGVVALGSAQGATAVIVAGVTPDLTSSVHAGNLVRDAAKFSGGKGGGRPDFAQAGGVKAAQLNETLDKLFSMVA